MLNRDVVIKWTLRCGHSVVAQGALCGAETINSVPIVSETPSLEKSESLNGRLQNLVTNYHHHSAVQRSSIVLCSDFNKFQLPTAPELSATITLCKIRPLMTFNLLKSSIKVL